jgi:hypothetical protein
MSPIQAMLQPIDNDLARLTDKRLPYRHEHFAKALIFRWSGCISQNHHDD